MFTNTDLGLIYFSLAASCDSLVEERNAIGLRLFKRLRSEERRKLHCRLCTLNECIDMQRELMRRIAGRTPDDYLAVARAEKAIKDSLEVSR